MAGTGVNKLNASQRERIRKLLDAGVTHADIAKLFGVARPAISYYRAAFARDSGAQEERRRRRREHDQARRLMHSGMREGSKTSRVGAVKPKDQDGDRSI